MHRPFFPFLAALTAVPLAVASAQVDESGVPDAPEVESTEEFMGSLSGNTDFGGELRTMKLSEAVALGIENNLDLQVQRFDPLIALQLAFLATMTFWRFRILPVIRHPSTSLLISTIKATKLIVDCLIGMNPRIEWSRSTNRKS